MGNEFADQDILWGKKLTDNLIDLPGLYPLFDRILERFAIEPLELPKPKLKIYSSFNKLIETKYILYTDGLCLSIRKCIKRAPKSTVPGQHRFGFEKPCFCSL